MVDGAVCVVDRWGCMLTGMCYMCVCTKEKPPRRLAGCRVWRTPFLSSPAPSGHRCSGVVKQKSYNPATGMDSLAVVPISRWVWVGGCIRHSRWVGGCVDTVGGWVLSGLIAVGSGVPLSCVLVQKRGS